LNYTKENKIKMNIDDRYRKRNDYSQNLTSQRFEAIDSIQVRNPWHQKMQQQSLQEGHTIKLCFRVFLLGRDDPILRMSQTRLYHIREEDRIYLKINGKS
jgi:hypothetical protein